MIISYSDLETIRKKHKNKKLVFAGGCFDLPHAGHVVFVEEAKKYGDILVVQIASNEEVEDKKGAGRPIFNEHVRAKIIDSLKPVDYAFIEKGWSKGAHPLQAKDEILDKLRPDVYVTNIDSSDVTYLENIAKKYGTKLIVLDRYCPPEFEGISTSKIVKKILGEKTD